MDGRSGVVTRRFYLAGPYSDRERLARDAQIIAEASGWQCNARWLYGTHDGMASQRAAIEDVEDVRAADALVIDARRPSTRGGMWVEAGIAIQAGKPIAVIARGSARLNVFMYLPGAYQAEDTRGAVALLAHFARGEEAS